MNKIEINSNGKEIKLINDKEITCEVFEEIPIIVEVLEKEGFKYIEEFVLNDIYMNNTNTNEFFLKNGRIEDSLVIRYVNENDKKIICKRRIYNNGELGISTKKSVLKVSSIEEAELHLNMLGYTRFLNMIDKNYRYENNDYIAYIQEVENLGIFLELEIKEIENKNQSVEDLIKYVKSLDLKIGTKFNVRKAELLYAKQKNKC